MLGALSVARERETGVLRQLLAQRVSPSRWVAGKYVGLAAAIGAALTPLAAVVLVALLVVAVPGQRVDTLLRSVAALAGNGAYLLAMLALGMTLSIVARSSRAALIAGLTLWVTIGLLGPRVAAHLASSLAPTPDSAAYEAAIGSEFASGFDDEPGWDARLIALEREAVTRYRVANLDDLPVGFSGLRMHAMSEWSDRVSDRQYAKLQDTYSRQERIRMASSLLSPAIAARAFSHGMAGMDWAHYRHFADAAEAYRRDFNVLMNELIVQRTRGQAWEMSADWADWARVPRFSYAPPNVAWALRQAWTPAAILALWLATSWALLAFSARRLRP